MKLSLRQILLDYRKCPSCGNHTYIASKGDQHELVCEECSWRIKIVGVSE